MQKTILILMAFAGLVIANYTTKGSMLEDDLQNPDFAREYVQNFYNSIGKTYITVVRCSAFRPITINGGDYEVAQVFITHRTGERSTLGVVVDMLYLPRWTSVMQVSDLDAFLKTGDKSWLHETARDGAPDAERPHYLSMNHDQGQTGALAVGQRIIVRPGVMVRLFNSDGYSGIDSIKEEECIATVVRDFGNHVRVTLDNLLDGCSVVEFNK